MSDEPSGPRAHGPTDPVDTAKLRFLRRRRSHHVVFAYRSERQARPALGILVLGELHWELRLVASAATVTWGVLGPDVFVRRRGLFGSEVAVRSAGGNHRAAFRLPFTRTSRLERLMARRRAAASASARQWERVRGGDWWLHPDALAGCGPARTISITDVRYLGGWSGRVRRFRSKRRGRILDLGPAGVSLRGLRRHIQIPWSEISSLEVHADDSGRSRLDVGLEAGGVAAFSIAYRSPEEVEAALEPVRREMAPAARP